jgi:SAM-dependent methyltransferase
LFGTDLGRDGGYVGVDLSPDQIALARAKHTEKAFVVADAVSLPFADRSFDLVVACEILEHVERPASVLEELRRVCAGRIIVSVPWEPWWRVLNCLRGKYLTRLGNTPGHVGHFSRRRIRNLVGRYFSVIAERRPVPWTMLLSRPSPS